MNIVIMGAGAIGSLFGALLSKNNNVLLIGRKPHVSVIKKSGLTIEGKTKLKVKINAENLVDNVNHPVDLLILTVRSYDTDSAILDAKKLIGEKTTVLSLQNGLDNLDKIKKIVSTERIIAGVTTNGAFFSKPGTIRHTGKGTTTLGELDGQKTKRIENIAKFFNSAGIETIVSDNIIKEIWIKAIINSSINPLTAFFRCKNGYLLENPILEKLVEKVCAESTDIANVKELDLSYRDMIAATKEVIRKTSDNYSSMLQSVLKDKKTEIKSINGRIAEMGKKHGVDTLLNDILVFCIKYYK